MLVLTGLLSVSQARYFQLLWTYPSVARGQPGIACGGWLIAFSPFSLGFRPWPHRLLRGFLRSGHCEHPILNAGGHASQIDRVGNIEAPEQGLLAEFAVIDPFPP